MSNLSFALHQPNLFPWLGFFNKLNTVDNFIFFDICQKQRGKSWTNRVKICNDLDEKWLTIPILKKNSDLQKIHEVEINTKELKFLVYSKLKAYYSKSMYKNEVFSFLEKLNWDQRSISSFNIEFITKLAGEMGIKTSFCLASDFMDSTFGLKGNDLIIKVLKEFGASSYVSGVGCKDFITPCLFEDQGISFSFLEYNHPFEERPAGLSILDYLFNYGFDAVKKVL